jgi:hypothetical protein
MHSVSASSVLVGISTFRTAGESRTTRKRLSTGDHAKALIEREWGTLLSSERIVADPDRTALLGDFRVGGQPERHIALRILATCRHIGTDQQFRSCAINDSGCVAPGPNLSSVWEVSGLRVQLPAIVEALGIASKIMRSLGTGITRLRVKPAPASNSRYSGTVRTRPPVSTSMAISASFPVE